MQVARRTLVDTFVVAISKNNFHAASEEIPRLTCSTKFQREQDSSTNRSLHRVSRPTFESYTHSNTEA